MANEERDRRGLRIERRAHWRQPVEIDVRLQVEIYGFGGAARPFFASGAATDLARGGMMARVDAPIERGAVCRVFFRDDRATVRPRHVSGRVVRCEEAEDGYRVAVAFARELLQVDEDEQELAATA